MRRIFLLSPASCAGQRAGYLLGKGATFELARRLRTTGITLGEAFAFMSGLYFRGKLAYAGRFSSDAPDPQGVLVIAPGRGLLPATTIVSAEDLSSMSRVPVDPGERAYAEPLLRDATERADRLGKGDQAVLLGSIASDKYVGILLTAFGQRLAFPSDFVGRGDMSRGGLMLRCVLESRELAYTPVLGAIRRGTRPPRLVRIKYPRDSARDC